MKYLCLVYLTEEASNAANDAPCAAYAQELFDRGCLLAAEALQRPTTATSVRVCNGEATLTDGPFATKEMLAGFYLVEAKDLNAAIQIAAQMPPAQYGTIEVRPVRKLAQGEKPPDEAEALAGADTYGII